MPALVVVFSGVVVAEVAGVVERAAAGDEVEPLGLEFKIAVALAIPCLVRSLVLVLTAREEEEEDEKGRVGGMPALADSKLRAESSVCCREKQNL